VGQKETTVFLSKKSDNHHFIVSGNIGYNFFKPSTFKTPSLSPLPHLQKNIFNPEIGGEFNPKGAVFDPETEEVIKFLSQNKGVKRSQFTKEKVIHLAKKRHMRNILVHFGSF
tara:strand:- start:311 stop:649 length:339 start_codon:yes stop_codon:yes gene_type:complete